MEVMNERADLPAFCPYYHRAVELIGRRWTGAILRALLAGVGRFSEVAATIPGLSDRMLSERLKELETEGIVERLVRAEKPVRVEYLLTEKGRALGAVVEAVAGWAEIWAVDRADSGRPAEAAQPPADRDTADRLLVAE
jgi:DNA-binding HxlR family transcriptional regulator